MLRSSSSIAMAVTATVLLVAPPIARSAIILGGDFGGANLTPNNGDILSGVFTNVGAFSVSAGTTVFVQSNTALSIAANTISILGTLDGSGAGFAGGAAVANGGAGSGNPGGGTGGGGGGLFGPSVHGSGGGGGGYGGNGGDSASVFGSGPPPALGGASYGDATSSAVQQGSGGGGGAPYNTSAGGASGAGGSGGGSISLFGSTIDLGPLGSILASGFNGTDGVPYGTRVATSAGGGGSGGGVLLDGLLSLDGLIDVSGGDGGNGSTQLFGSGGGGGAGGRIKLFGVAGSTFGAGFSFDIAGGVGGNYASDYDEIPSTPGAIGSYSYIESEGVVPEPASLAVWSGIAAFAGFGVWRKRRAA